MVKLSDKITDEYKEKLLEEIRQFAKDFGRPPRRLHVIGHFIGESVDLSGENRKSPYDGICPTGKIYDAKSARLIGGKWQINLKNIHKAKVQWWYLGLFDKNFEELLYVFRIPSEDFEEDIEKEFMLIYMKGDHRYTIESMKKYDISEKFKGCKNPIIGDIDDDDDDEYIKMEDFKKWLDSKRKE